MTIVNKLDDNGDSFQLSQAKIRTIG